MPASTLPAAPSKTLEGFCPQWYEKTLGQIAAQQPLAEGEVLLIFDIDGTVYWDHQCPPKDGKNPPLTFVEALGQTQKEFRFPAGVPNSWIGQQTNNNITYIQALTCLPAEECMKRRGEWFGKWNQTLRGLIEDGVVEDSPDARMRYWHAIQYGSQTECEGDFIPNAFGDWISPCERTVHWMRTLPPNYRKIALTNASEYMGLERLKALGFSPYEDFDIVLGAEFMEYEPKPKHSAFERAIEVMGVSRTPSDAATAAEPKTPVKAKDVPDGFDSLKDDSVLHAPLSVAVNNCRGWSHPVVMFEDSVRNVNAAKEIGLGVVRIRAPGRPDQYQGQFPVMALIDQEKECDADVVVNRLIDLQV